MKVLHILSSNRYSGAENVACQIISMFNNGDDFEFAYASPDGEIKSSLNERGIKFLPMAKSSKSEVKRVINEFKPDIIHAHDIKAICMALLATKKIKVIGHVHRNHPDFHKFSLRSVIFKYFSKKKNLSKIIWVSQGCFDDYIFNKSIAFKSVVLKNIINIESIKNRAKSAEVQDKSDIVFLGRLTDVKNPLRILEIVKLLIINKPDLKVAIVGDGELYDEMQNVAAEGNLQNNVKFYGYQSNGYGLLKNSKVFLMTSKTEGLPMSILEAQVFGLPVVCTKILGLEELIIEDSTGFMYTTNSQAVSIIESLLNDKDNYKKLQSNVQNFSKSFNNIEKYKEKIVSIYKG